MICECKGMGPCNTLAAQVVFDTTQKIQIISPDYDLLVNKINDCAVHSFI